MQRPRQNAQLIPGTSGMQPLNQMYNYPGGQQGNQLAPQPIRAPARQLSPKKSNGNLKAIVDFAV